MESVEVVRSTDWSYFAPVCKTSPRVLQSSRLLFFRIYKNKCPVGGFVVIPRPLGRAEIHTEVEPGHRGLGVIEAGNQLRSILKTMGFNKLTTYATARHIGTMSVACGFRRVGVVGKRVYYEMSL